MKKLNKFKLMNKYISLIIIWLLFSTNVISDILPAGFINNFDYSSVKPYIVPLTEENLNRSENDENGALWAGFFLETDIDPFYTGEIINWKNGETSWVFKINTPGAPALAVFFNQLSLSKGSRITVFPEDYPEKSHTIFENEINTDIISFPIMKGETLIVEYTEKTSDNEGIKGFFVICDVMVIFRGFDITNDSREIRTAQECHVNVNCSPEGDNWQNQKRSVVRIILRKGTKSYWCSGSLVNNTNNDCKPFILTAYHCGGDASVSDRERWQFYFNYEHQTCENTGDPPIHLITGCSLLSQGTLSKGSDFQLLLLKTPLNLTWKPYYNGWDSNEEASPSGVCIHHPDGDAKKISTYKIPANSLSNPIEIEGETMALNSTWQIFWSETENGHGVTQGGSSGSPLFNSRGLIVGTLTGGSTNCDDGINSFDIFGKFSYHWESNGNTNNKKLRPWLDPQNTGVRSHSSYDPDFTYHDVTFYVVNTWDEPVVDARIDVYATGNSKTTDKEGKATMSLPQMINTYSVSKNGYYKVTGDFEVTEDGSLRILSEDGKIKMVEDLQYITLFLNPKTGQLNIANANDVKLIKIYNFEGQFLFEQEIDGEVQKSIDVNFLRTGMYIFVTQDTKGANKMYKLLKFY